MSFLLRTLFCLSLLSSGTTAFSQADLPDVQNLLSNVSKSVRTHNYRGRLTYEHSGKLEVIEIAHGMIDGVEHEKIFYLNGPDRALAKNGRNVSCQTLGGILLGGGAVQLDDGSIARLENSYELKLHGIERVAGRESWVVQLLPRDDHRHSVIVAVDRESYLPTKTLFVTKARKVLERLHFVSLETGVDFVEEDFGNSAQHLHRKEECPRAPDDIVASAEWRPVWVPNGFVLANYSYSKRDGHMETYTDGLASFSVFTKPVNVEASGAGVPSLSTSFKKGATVGVMRLLSASNASSVHVSVLGEIPSETANRIIASVAASQT